MLKETGAEPAFVYSIINYFELIILCLTGSINDVVYSLYFIANTQSRKTAVCLTIASL